MCKAEDSVEARVPVQGVNDPQVVEVHGSALVLVSAKLVGIGDRVDISVIEESILVVCVGDYSGGLGLVRIEESVAPVTLSGG